MKYLGDIFLILVLLFIICSLIYAGFMINPYLGFGFGLFIFLICMIILIKSMNEYYNNMENNTGDKS